MATSKDNGNEIMVQFTAYLLRRITKANEENTEVAAAELAVINRFLSDQAITLASVRKGDFGPVAQVAAEEFPFNDDGRPRGEVIMGVFPATKAD
jgi:hypothetical protein